MTTKVLNRFDIISGIPDGDLMRFHDFLNGCSDISESDINSSSLYTFIGGLFDSGEEVIESWIKGYCESTIDDISINLGTKIDLHDIVFSQNSVIARIWSIMCGTIVNTTTSWESNTSFESAGLYQSSIRFFDVLAQID